MEYEKGESQTDAPAQANHHEHAAQFAMAISNSATSVIEPAALPAARMMSRPRGGGSGKFGGRIPAGWAAATALRNSDSSKSRAEVVIVFRIVGRRSRGPRPPEYGKTRAAPLSLILSDA
jgi:hypothetical protein